MMNQQGNRSGGMNIPSENFTNGGFGESDPAPLGSGIALLMGLGLGYVALKKKED